MKKREKQKRRPNVRKKRREPPRGARIEADDVEPEPVVEDADEPPPPPVPVVGIGASAGGLEAFSQILDALDEEPGVALVFVAHLAPQHESALPTLLGGRTSLPVIQVREGTHVELNRVYVIPPNAQMEIRDGELHLNPRPGDITQYTPIDFFFRSLAETARSGAIGVILSGSSSDGAVGFREIKAVGGITIAQDPETARYDGMPRAAIATEAVDLVLSPAEIAKEIIRIGHDPYVRPAPRQTEAEEFAIDDVQFKKLVSLLRAASGIDFTHYKPPTLKRRLQRRMVVRKLSDVGQYLRYLETTPDEAQKLSEDILIHVTRFFRDPESFEALAQEVFPELVADRSGENPIRIWVPGCSTGEEAYSVAIALLEHLGQRAGTMPIQIFATDVSESAIDYARNGVYPQTIAADVSAERLRRFFSKTDGGYRISKMVRDLCVLARQDLTRDPPFSKLDLIVCRNVLIYLGTLLQTKLLNVFHYALKASGFLVLGHAETTGKHSESFALANKRHRIYRKKPNGSLTAVAFPIDFAAPRGVGNVRKTAETRASASVQSEAQRVMLDRFAPPGVVVDDDLRIIQFIGHTGRFLEPAPGDANLALPKMVRDGLLHGLRTAFHQARREGQTIRRGGLHLRSNGHEVEVTLEVSPLGAGKERYYLVLFQEGPGGRPSAPRDVVRPSRGKAKEPRLAKLEQELAASRDSLQSIIQELEAANEELQSANEEILSSNEELQSTNEELDTAKEELQSTNEELNTVNEELHGRNDELSRANSDLMNLLSSVQATLVIVANDLRIRRFTPFAERVLNLIPSDVGRPIGHIKPNIDCPDLEQLIEHVIEMVAPCEREVQDQQGRWFMLQIRPYKNVDNRIEGAVLALFDIDSTKRYEAEIRASREYAEAIFETTRDALVVLDGDLRVKKVNKAFRDTFKVPRDDAEGRLLYEIGEGEWNIPKLRDGLVSVMERSPMLADFRIDHAFPSTGYRSMIVNARRVDLSDGSLPVIVVAMREVTAPAS